MWSGMTQVRPPNQLYLDRRSALLTALFTTGAGRQLADVARRLRPDLKVLFITGYAENAGVGNGQMAAGMQVMTKPFALEQLAARVQAILATGQDATAA